MHLPISELLVIAIVTKKYSRIKTILRLAAFSILSTKWLRGFPVLIRSVKKLSDGKRYMQSKQTTNYGLASHSLYASQTRCPPWRVPWVSDTTGTSVENGSLSSERKKNNENNTSSLNYHFRALRIRYSHNRPLTAVCRYWQDILILAGRFFFPQNLKTWLLSDKTKLGKLSRLPWEKRVCN